LGRLTTLCLLWSLRWLYGLLWLHRLYGLLWLRGLCRLPRGRGRATLWLLSTKHATDSLADTPDRLAEPLANAARRLSQSLTESANCLAEAVG
jgi:hypothetical protein